MLGSEVPLLKGTLKGSDPDGICSPLFKSGRDKTYLNVIAGGRLTSPDFLGGRSGALCLAATVKYLSRCKEDSNSQQAPTLV